MILVYVQVFYLEEANVGRAAGSAKPPGSVVSPCQRALQRVSLQLRFWAGDAGGTFGVISGTAPARAPAQVRSRLCAALVGRWVAMP